MILFVKSLNSLKNRKIIVAILDPDSTARDIKDALNDLPTLYPNLIMDVNQTIASNGKDLVLIIKFSPELGICLF